MKCGAFSKLLRLAALALPLFACAPPLPPQVAPPVFAVRAPPAGRPGYVATIRYIDDGVRYVNPGSAFFIARDGRMCFRGLLNVERIEIQYNHDWCISPFAVSRVEDVWNDTTLVPEMLLWCKHAYPNCVRDIEAPVRTTNLALVQVLPAHEERRAIEHLIYLMGGNLGDSHPFAASSIPLGEAWAEPPAAGTTAPSLRAPGSALRGARG